VLRIRVNSWNSCKRRFESPHVVSYGDLLLQQPVDVGGLRIKDAHSPHFLEDAAQCLFWSSGAGLGFAHDLFEFGGDEVSAGEDAVFRSRGDALDGGGDAFVPGHFLSLKSKVQSLKSKLQTVAAGGRLWTLDLKLWTQTPLVTRHPVLFNPRRATSTDDWSSDEFFRYRFA
jgi:hypothetical protein